VNEAKWARFGDLLAFIPNGRLVRTDIGPVRAHFAVITSGGKSRSAVRSVLAFASHDS
jgi:hypothetical protein